MTLEKEIGNKCSTCDNGIYSDEYKFLGCGRLATQEDEIEVYDECRFYEEVM